MACTLNLGRSWSFDETRHQINEVGRWCRSFNYRAVSVKLEPVLSTHTSDGVQSCELSPSSSVLELVWETRLIVAGFLCLDSCELCSL